YYHSDCKNINEFNRSTNNGRYKNETRSHLGAKRKIFELLLDESISLIDQNYNIITLDMEFVAIESPVTNLHKNRIPFINLKECANCVNQYKKVNDFNIGSKREFFDKLNIASYKHKSGNEIYYQHPCLNCPFNNLKYRYVFDIGIGKNGYYTGAIEILHTSEIKKEKILFCIENNIELIEFPSTIIKVKNENKELNCERIWWKDEKDQIHISNKYSRLFQAKKGAMYN
ncbi:hypothetical protein, partial [Brevibacillus brevis]|uniref:hypothetical protein n=1 Tax=Brevibacillus brevis TaxID=1393 RepID=UPI001C12A81A